MMDIGKYAIHIDCLIYIYVTKHQTHEYIHVIPNNVWCMMYCLMYPMYSKTLQTLHHTGYIDNHEQKSILCIWQFRFLCFSQGWFKIDHTSGLVIAFTYPRPMLNRIWLLVMTQHWRNQNTQKEDLREWSFKYDNTCCKFGGFFDSSGKTHIMFQHFLTAAEKRPLFNFP